MTLSAETKQRIASLIGSDRVVVFMKGSRNQLVEMAVRAMSPAINDPFTAMTCLDHLGNVLALFARQGEESLNTYDREGQVRLVF